MLDKEKIKNSLTIEDIKLILTDLGNDTFRYDNSNNLIARSICHGGCKHKLYYYHKDKRFSCYTDCGETFDIYTLVAKVKHYRIPEDFPKAVTYVAQATGKWIVSDGIKKDDHVSDEDMLYKLDSQLSLLRKDKKQEPVELTVFSENVLGAFIPLSHELWVEEGISAETMEKYKISYHMRTDKIVIPHYDINDNLVGIRGRALLEEDLERGNKYMPLVVNGVDYRHNLSLNWYGINHTQHAIKRLKRAIVFEAEKSVLKCEEYLQQDNHAVASCGSSVSPIQRNILLDQGIKELVIAYDKEFTDPQSDEAFRYMDKLTKIANMFLPFVDVYIIWDEENILDLKDSPVDKGGEAFIKLLEQQAYRVKRPEEIQRIIKV